MFNAGERAVKRGTDEAEGREVITVSGALRLGHEQFPRNESPQSERQR